MSSNHCNRGKDLLIDLQRAEWLPVYDEEGVRSIAKEMNDLWNAYESISSVPDFDTEVISLYYKQCIDRNQKYLHAYFLHRLEKIRDVRFTLGSMMNDKLSDKLCSQEIDYFAKYNRLINSYNSQLGIDLISNMQPPRDLSIEVKVLVDCGEIATDFGSIKLTAGSIHFIKRSDIDHLLRQGLLEEVRK